MTDPKRSRPPTTTDFTSLDLSDLPPAQQMIVTAMLRFQNIYQGDPKKIQEAFAAYDEEYAGPRFDLPLFNASIGPQPFENILRYRVWHKSKDPENPGSSECVTFMSLEESLMGREMLIKEGYLRVDPPIGVCWDNAVGGFAECRIKEFEPFYSTFEKANKK